MHSPYLKEKEIILELLKSSFPKETVARGQHFFEGQKSTDEISIFTITDLFSYLNVLSDHLVVVLQ
jgi:hypothetical protein